MKLNFYGAAGTVTGSCFLIDTGLTRVMIDCGMFQGSKEINERNYREFPVNPASVDYVLLTHAHIDHSGLIPKLVKEGYKGNIYATAASAELCTILLKDSGYIQEMEVERKNRKNKRSGMPLLTPIYTADDASACLSKFRKVAYNETLNLTPEIRVRFLDAGHILGSAILEVWVREGARQTKLIFSGDLGIEGKPYIDDPSTIAEADCVIMESTYGSRVRKDQFNRLEQFHDVLWETYKKGGNLVIPAFAVARTQDLLYDIYVLSQEKRFPPMDVYIDSPMAIAVTEVFKKYQTGTAEELEKERASLEMPNLKFSRTTEESIALNKINHNAVIISASGMCDAGRIKHHLKHNLWRPESTVLLVGFQALGTKGRLLLDGADFIRIHGEDVKVRADIRQIDGYSSHADQSDLLGWLGKFRSVPGQVFLVHGEPNGALALAGLIKEKYGVDPVIPQYMETFDITPGSVFTRDHVMEAQAAVTAKLRALLNEGRISEYSEIMRKLNDLDSLINSLSGKS